MLPKTHGRFLYLIGIVAILLLAVGLRIYALEADAPLSISPTQELSLDGAVTISGGRDKVLFGEWEPYPAPLYAYQLYPFMNWLAYGFFTLLGIGYWQANFISVVTGFFSIIFMAGFAKEQFGRRTALLTALFMAINYVYIIYNRDPMAYTTVSCGIAFSLFLWGKGLRKPIWLFWSGAVLVCTTLFVKLPAIALLPALLLGSWTHLRQQKRLPNATALYKPLLTIGGGVAAAGLLWLFFIYLPNPEAVGKAYYARTFSLSNGLVENIRFAVASLLFMGVDFGFFLRILPLFALSYGYLFFRAAQLLSKNKPTLSPAETAALTLLVSMIGMLFFTAIRPLRYQIMLIPPMSLTAALAVNSWLRTTAVQPPTKFNRLYPLFIFSGLAYFSYQMLAALLMLGRIIRFNAGPVDGRVAPDIATLFKLFEFSLLLGIAGAILFLWRATRPENAPISLPARKRRRQIALLMILFIVTADLYQQCAWILAPQYSIVEASRQMGRDFDADTTIVGGTYAHALTLENTIPSVWFYGHSPKEDIEAATFTHIAVETKSPLANDETHDVRLRENMPQLMQNARPIKIYAIRNYEITVYEVDR